MMKPNANKWTVCEQIIEDPVTGLTFQFEVMPDGEPRFRVFGKGLIFGNREFHFNVDGVKSGTGTVTGGLCRPTWITPVDDL